MFKDGVFIETKSLKVNDNISFVLSTDIIIDGVIIDKIILENGDIRFSIKTDNGKVLTMKHNNLDLYFKY